MQQTLHLGTVFAITVTIRSLIITSLLAEEFPDILNALRLLLVLAHHAERRRKELLAVLHLIEK
jgi:L-lactate permease